MNRRPRLLPLRPCLPETLAPPIVRLDGPDPGNRPRRPPRYPMGRIRAQTGGASGVQSASSSFAQSDARGKRPTTVRQGGCAEGHGVCPSVRATIQQRAAQLRVAHRPGGVDHDADAGWHASRARRHDAGHAGRAPGRAPVAVVLAAPRRPRPGGPPCRATAATAEGGGTPCPPTAATPPELPPAGRRPPRPPGSAPPPAAAGSSRSTPRAPAPRAPHTRPHHCHSPTRPTEGRGRPPSRTSAGTPPSAARPAGPASTPETSAPPWRSTGPGTGSSSLPEPSAATGSAPAARGGRGPSGRVKQAPGELLAVRSATSWCPSGPGSAPQATRSPLSAPPSGMR